MAGPSGNTAPGIAIAALLGAILLAAFWFAQRQEAPPPVAPPKIAPLESGRRISVAPDPGQAGLPISTVLNVRRAMHYGDYIWDESGVAPGSAWVRVDLDAQIISVFRAGHEIGTAVILYGADKKPTPTGRFPILAKLKDHQSSLYDAKMPYTLRLTGDGIAIHGSNVRKGLATNGCIGVPEDFAAKLFDQMNVGSEVVIVRGLRPA